jgi:hypothetical protein
VSIGTRSLCRTAYPDTGGAPHHELFDRLERREDTAQRRATKRTDQARVLADFLAPLLPNLCDASTPLAVLATEHEEVVDSTEPDVHLAVRLELQHIVSTEPDLVTLAADASEPERNRAAERLSQLLLDRDDHAVEVLWALLAGSGTKPHLDVINADADSAAPSDPRWWSAVPHIRKFLRAGWLRREVAAIWMNALIAAVLFFTWWLTWPPPGGGPLAGTLALGIFAIWVLAFLPGWLYIRFLGQRAGALWDEYVLSLHRLAWDSPGCPSSSGVRPRHGCALSSRPPGRCQ